MTKKVSFNELLVEAEREDVEIDMPDGTPIVVKFPNGEQVKALRAAMIANDEDAALLAIFGDEDGKRLLESFKTLPGDMPGRVTAAVMEEFGITPNVLTSST